MPSPLTGSRSQAEIKWLKLAFIIAGLCLLSAVWYTNTIVPDILVRDVNQITNVSLFETKWLYSWLLVFTGIFPLIFGFIPKPEFYRQLKHVMIANIPVTIVFILWDFYFTTKGVWGF